MQSITPFEPSGPAAGPVLTTDVHLAEVSLLLRGSLSSPAPAGT